MTTFLGVPKNAGRMHRIYNRYCQEGSTFTFKDNLSKKEGIEMENNMDRAIVNPQWKKLLGKTTFSIVETKPRYRYEQGHPTEAIIGGRMRLLAQGGELDGETVSVTVSVEDYHHFHINDHVELQVIDAKLSGWSDNRGFGHVAVKVEGKLQKGKEE